jgi:hypothetical protein
MSAESALKVVSETNETKGQIQRTPDGRFAEGTCGGPGGSRPGSGRKPKPADETLLKRLYDLLDQNADKALQVLVDQLEHEDPKIAQKAAAIVLSKTLPESRFLESWREEGEPAAEELNRMMEYLDWKRQRDLAEEADGESTTGDGPKAEFVESEPAER